LGFLGILLIIVTCYVCIRRRQQIRFQDDERVAYAMVMAQQGQGGIVMQQIGPGGAGYPQQYPPQQMAYMQQGVAPVMGYPAPVPVTNQQQQPQQGLRQ
jgi:hypothetical protein